MARRVKDERKRRDIAFFVRVNEKELDIIEAAIKLRYGDVDGFKSEFARQAMLVVAKQIIEQARRRRAREE